MLSSFVDGTDNSGTSIPSFSPPAGDETLVLAAKNGDEQAFEILVERHRRKLFVVALRISRVREDAEDIAQQSFQKAFLHLRRFEGKSSFLTWLTRIAINEALMWLRGSHRHREMPIDEVSDDVGQAFWRVQVSDSDPDPEASYLQQEETQILAAAMGELKPGLRRAIELRDLEELSTAETAQRMGLSISATKSTLSRGRRKLREALKRNVRSPRMPRGNSRRSHSQPSEKASPRRMSSGWREGALYGDGSVDRNICSPCVSQLHRS
jgi:RNA polymerase sigma-70 factor (ECF subfamily)